MSRTSRHRGSVALVSATAIAAIVSTASAASFIPVGPLPGDTISRVYRISTDGSVVAGESEDASGNVEAFYYNVLSDTLVGIGTPGGWSNSRARGVDTDTSGNVHLAGYGTNAFGNNQAFYYDASTSTFTAIPFLSSNIYTGESYAQACRVHNNGWEAVVVGWSTRDSGPEHAFRWRTGAPESSLDLGDVPTGEGRSFAYDVGFRNDGYTVVKGWGDTGYPSGGHNPGAFGWYSANSTNYFLGFIDKPFLSTSQSFARGMSSNGDYYVGCGTYNAFCSSNRQAYIRYVEEKDAKYWPLQLCTVPEYPESVLLGYLAGHEGFSEAWAVSKLGYVAVGCARLLIDDGNYTCHWGENEYVAFIWDRDNGMRDLKQVLENDYGLDLTGWVLTNAYGISDDGTIISGTGLYDDGSGAKERGWVAIISDLTPQGACCLPNLSCIETTESNCPGNFQGIGTTCATTLCCPVPFADGDQDGDVDQTDFGLWQLCYDGGTGLIAGCECYDRDNNNKVDSADFLEFANCFTGANVPYSPSVAPSCNP